MPPKESLQFTDAERQLAQQTLTERYGEPVPLDVVDIEANDDTFPALFWLARGAEFLVAKTGQAQFRAQFFYSENEAFGTGIEHYDNLGDCLVSVLQVQADHEAERHGTPRRVIQPAITGDDYNGPLVI